MRRMDWPTRHFLTELGALYEEEAKEQHAKGNYRTALTARFAAIGIRSIIQYEDEREAAE